MENIYVINLLRKFIFTCYLPIKKLMISTILTMQYFCGFTTSRFSVRFLVGISLLFSYLWFNFINYYVSVALYLLIFCQR